MRILFNNSFLLLLIWGCGKNNSSAPSSASPSDALQGTWGYEIDANCSYAFTLNDTKYTVLNLCLSGNKGYAEIEAGTASVTTSDLTLTPEKYSCANQPLEASTSKYAITNNGKNLNVYLEGGAISFAKLPTETEEPFSYSIVYGCYDTEGNFTENSTFTL